MIKKHRTKINYICPVYNEAINDGKVIKASLVDEMWGMGTPEELDKFLKILKIMLFTIQKSIKNTL